MSPVGHGKMRQFSVCTWEWLRILSRRISGSVHLLDDSELLCIMNFRKASTNVKEGGKGELFQERGEVGLDESTDRKRSGSMASMSLLL